MKTRNSLLVLSAALLLGGQAIAQSEEDTVLKEYEQRQKRAELEMREAERQIEEAARKMAELSNERLGALGEAERWATLTGDRPRIGINIESEKSGGPVEGVGILSVTPGSAADEAGLRAGDVITAVNGESMSAENMYKAAMLMMDFMKGVEVGDKLDVEYLRDGKVGSIEVEPRLMSVYANIYTGEHGAIAPKIQIAPGTAQTYSFSFGGWRGGWGDLELVELSEGLGRYFGTDKGLLVVSAPESNAFQLQDGDVIQSIDGRDPTSVNHCMRILTSYQPGEKLKLAILRDKKKQTIEVEVPDDRTSRLEIQLPATIRPVSVPLPPVEPRAPRIDSRT